jgi:hypothetical protein
MRKSRRWLLPFLTVAFVATPSAVRLHSKDKPAAGDEEAVAKKVDDTTRLGSEKAKPHALAPVIEAARASRDAIHAIPGYSATLTKQELTPKKGMIRHVMKLKFRRDPFSVYLKFVDPHEGREVIFVEGKNKGKLLVHEASGIVSLAGTISLSPTGDEAMKENRYPITNIGMEKLVEAMILQWEQESKFTESAVTVFPQAKIGDVECRMFEITHPKERPQFKYKMTRLYIDKKAGLPIRLEQYAFPAKGGETAPLVEEYTYADVKVESKLADLDFDVKNQQYSFK